MLPRQRSWVDRLGLLMRAGRGPIYWETKRPMYKFAVVAVTWTVVMYWFLSSFTNVLA